MALRDWEKISSLNLPEGDYAPETAASRKTRDIERIEEGITDYDIDITGGHTSEGSPKLPSIYRMMGGGGFSKLGREVRYYGDGTGSQADRKERVWDRQDEGVLTGSNGDEIRYSTVGRKPRRYREPSIITRDGQGNETTSVAKENGTNDGHGTAPTQNATPGSSEGHVGSTEV